MTKNKIVFKNLLNFPVYIKLFQLPARGNPMDLYFFFYIQKGKFILSAKKKKLLNLLNVYSCKFKDFQRAIKRLKCLKKKVIKWKDRINGSNWFLLYAWVVMKIKF